MSEGEWLKAKSRAIKRLIEHAEKGLVDKDIEEFLFKLNEKECLYTTSSCSGRVAIIEGPSLFSKKDSRLLRVSHNPRECRGWKTEELYIEPNRIIWLSLQPPILHIVTRSIDVAESIVRCADRSGFNRACYKRYRAGGFHVEIAVSDKLHIIGFDNETLNEACKILQVYKERLEDLKRCLIKLDCQ